MDKIVCLGSNYLDHARKFSLQVPEQPVLFIKPPSVLRVVKRNRAILRIPFPKGMGKVHPECEIVFKLKKGGSHLSEAQAAGIIGAATLGLDVTFRDLQNQLKAKSHPWTVSKVFANSAIVGPWSSAAKLAHLLEVPFSFAAGGELLQGGRGVDMRLSPAKALAYISRYFPLCAGDLIFTGTPGDVSSLQPGVLYELKWQSLQYGIQWI